VGLTFTQRLALDLNSKRLELPAFPDSVIRIQHALKDESKEVDDLVDILSSDPAVAAKLLQTANSAALNPRGNEITSLRMALVRMGRKIVSSVSVAFAMQQLKNNQSYTQAQHARLESIWNSSVDVAAISHVLAKKLTRLSADEALLAGLLHVLGHLYVFTRAMEEEDLSPEELDAIDRDWHATIAKAIVETWGMSAELVSAMEQQDDYENDHAGDVNLTDVLVCAKMLAQARSADTAAPTGQDAPALLRLGLVDSADEPASIEQFAEEIEKVRSALLG
jgi:HD-like signal output (HDOD) protein